MCICDEDLASPLESSKQSLGDITAKCIIFKGIKLAMSLWTKIYLRRISHGSQFSVTVTLHFRWDILRLRS